MIFAFIWVGGSLATDFAIMSASWAYRTRTSLSSEISDVPSPTRCSASRMSATIAFIDFSDSVVDLAEIEISFLR